MYIYLGKSTCVISDVHSDHWFRFQAPFNDDLAGKEVLDNWHRSIIWISLIVQHLPFWQTWYYTVSKTRNQAPLIYRIWTSPPSHKYTCMFLFLGTAYIYAILYIDITLGFFYTDMTSIFFFFAHYVDFSSLMDFQFDPNSWHRSPVSLLPILTASIF